MKRVIYPVLLLVLASWGVGLSAAPVDQFTAERVASLFYQVMSRQPASHLTLVQKVETNFLFQQTHEDATPIYYVFNVGEDQGFVLVSGDDRVMPILGYSTTNRFDPDDVPDGLTKVLQAYVDEITYVIEFDIPATRQIQEDWNSLVAGSFTLPIVRAGVNPLMSTTWNQAPYYNQLCPFDNQYSDLTVTGCVATAMCQIMKYWDYPTQGSGFHSYNHGTFGTISANFGATTYDWASMPNNLTGNNTAVATLMYHVGVSVDMNYGVSQTGGSGAYVVSAASPTQHCSEYALETYFGYDANSLQGVLRDNYTTASWIQMLKGELDAGRPILYAGFGSGGGHAWVCDGYDNDFFHMNWGWGGSSDGYFTVDALNPGTLGAGGGNGGFNSGQQAVIGIKPPNGGGGGGGGTSGTAMALYDAISATPNPLDYGGTLNVSFNVINGDANAATFTGEIAAALFDEGGAFVDFVGTATESNGLPGGYVYNNNISFSSTIDATPGQYYVGVFVQPIGGNWIAVGDGSYTNFVQISISSDNDIQMNSDFTLSQTPVRQGEPFDVTVNVVNTGASAFTGTYSIDLHQTDGTWIETLAEINENNGLPSGYTYTAPGIPFSGNITNVDPGTYLLVLWEKATTGDWEVVGTDGTYPNPIQVTVAAPLLSGDQYENNDTEGQAYTLPISFNGNNAATKTSGSSIHVGSDYDYYKIELAAGAGYTITARVQDSWNSNDGQAYTNDALFSYKVNNGDYSKTFDDVMSTPITVNGPATVYFHVAPYFQGETGTYALDLKVTSGAASGITAADLPGSLKMYPNPARHELYVETTPEMGRIEQAQILDVTGRVLWEDPSPMITQDRLQLSGWDLPAGAYVLMLSSANGHWKQKLVIE